MNLVSHSAILPYVMCVVRVGLQHITKLHLLSHVTNLLVFQELKGVSNVRMFFTYLFPQEWWAHFYVPCCGLGGCVILLCNICHM